ncbi:MAG: hypothetical protein HQK62_00850 [Desulfamplus sp.]|nr:hypothetical protein [Desulfamplus sp.]MBF0257380.1 hypothetical protein [Desulfamplus sp.]
MSQYPLAQLDSMLEIMEQDLGLINSTFKIMSLKEEQKLSKDIKYLLLDNIARKIRFSFYDISNKDDVLYEYIYKINGVAEKTDFPESFDDFHVDTIAFDVFIDFTETFLSLRKQQRDTLLGNTEYDWFV